MNQPDKATYRSQSKRFPPPDKYLLIKKIMLEYNQSARKGHSLLQKILRANRGMS